jgi:hypothetical protein
MTAQSVNGTKPVKTLTLAQRVAIMTTQASLNQLIQQEAQLRQQLQALVQEAGLDPVKNWSISPAGEVAEAPTAMPKGARA